MPRVRNTYQVETILVGPAPASGWFFMNYTGGYNNTWTDLRPSKQTQYKYSRSAQFKASSLQYLSIVDNAELSVGSTDFTIAGWVLLDTKTQNRPIIAKDAIGSIEFALLYENPSSSDRFSFLVGNGGSTQLANIKANSYGSPPIGQWIFVVVWLDSSAGTINIQINDGTVDSIASATAGNGTANFRIGNWQRDGSFMDGRIDSVGFWKRTLTASEKTALYNGGRGLHYLDLTTSQKNALVSWWDFEIDTQLGKDSHSTNHLTNVNGVVGNDGVTDSNVPLRGEFWANSEFTTMVPQSPFPGAISTAILVDKNNNDLVRNHNLIKKIDRVQSMSYELIEERTNVKQLGKRNFVGQPIINSPTVRIQFDYLTMGLKNEARLGFNVNYPKFEHPFDGNEPFYLNNFKVCVFSGLANRKLERNMREDPYWPFSHRDKRNLFVVVAQEGQDANNAGLVEDFSEPDIYQLVNQRAPNQHVISFGNCYISSWKTEASVGGFARCSVTYIGENIQFNLSGSGVPTPALDPKTRKELTGIAFVLPETKTEGGPSVIRPGDITIDITTAITGEIRNVGLVLDDAKINSYVIGVDFDRNDLNSLGYRLPRDREINFPIIVSLDVSMIVGDMDSGSWVDLVNEDEFYNVTIKGKMPICYLHHRPTGHPKQDGIPTGENCLAFRYDFLNAKLNKISYDMSIKEHKKANFNFTTEVDLEDFTKGFFVSGLLNIEKIQDFLLYEHISGTAFDDAVFLLFEDGSPIVNNLIPLY
jgi:hypothetical protein